MLRSAADDEKVHTDSGRVTGICALTSERSWIRFEPVGDEHYLEDIHVGDRFRSADYAVTEREIIEYATRYDPQPFHTNPIAAPNPIFGGLVASGWFTASITMRLI